MMKHQVRNINQGFAYILDCQLATVGGMAMKKSTPKGEFSRQIRIAQTMLDWAKDFDVDLTTTRAEDIIKSNQTVEAWAAQYRS